MLRLPDFTTDHALPLTPAESPLHSSRRLWDRARSSRPQSARYAPRSCRSASFETRPSRQRPASAKSPRPNYRAIRSHSNQEAYASLGMTRLTLSHPLLQQAMQQDSTRGCVGRDVDDPLDCKGWSRKEALPAHQSTPRLDRTKLTCGD